MFLPPCLVLSTNFVELQLGNQKFRHITKVFWGHKKNTKFLYLTNTLNFDWNFSHFCLIICVWQCLVPPPRIYKLELTLMITTMLMILSTVSKNNQRKKKHSVDHRILLSRLSWRFFFVRWCRKFTFCVHLIVDWVRDETRSRSRIG